MKRSILSSFLAVALAVVMVAPAMADSIHIGGTENITNEGGAGGAGGTGVGIGVGKGGDATINQVVAPYQKTDVKNTNTNVNVNENKATAISGAAAKSSSKSGVKDSGNSNVVIDASTGDTPYQAPSVFAPNLAVAPETCMGSVSTGGTAGFSGMGVGFSFGTTWKSHDCELRMFARSLQSLGVTYVPAAVALLAQNDDVKKALTDAGIQIPGQKVAAVAGPAYAASATPAPVVIQAAVQQEKRNDSGLVCSGNDLKVRAGNGEYFCRAR